jgi:hypothetical protein
VGQVRRPSPTSSSPNTVSTLTRPCNGEGDGRRVRRCHGLTFGRGGSLLEYMIEMDLVALGAMTYSQMLAFLVGGPLGFSAGVARMIGVVAFDISHEGKALRYLLAIRSDADLPSPVPEQHGVTPPKDRAPYAKRAPSATNETAAESPRRPFWFRWAAISSDQTALPCRRRASCPSCAPP